MLRSNIKTRCTQAYAGMLVLAAMYLVLFTATMHAQELPNAPQAVIKQRELPLHKTESLPKNSGLNLGSADWFRERGHLKLARFVPVLTRIDWNISYDKPKESVRSSHKSR